MPKSTDVHTPSDTIPSSFTVVLDAGHGGEDGGAGSADGIVEKDLNLALTLQLGEMLQANGIRVVYTRKTDTLLYDKNADYQGRKKVLDMAERLRIAQEAGECIFVSIHMNTHPLTSCKGLQVWYSENNTESIGLAQRIQTNIKALQPQNARRIKPSNGTIYLLRQLECPAILVECGFLSNPEEARQLNDEEYRAQLALVLVASILESRMQN
ncbi:MAG: N-acetylmuramoyl-L-alanine amidase [Clostridia bacterium]|nr:N-acetylmuramoyl-L-alanine amidase [Clostridia bacterium]